MLIEGNGYAGLIAEYIWSFICIFFLTLLVSVRRGFKAIVMANPPDIYFRSCGCGGSSASAQSSITMI